MALTPKIVWAERKDVLLITIELQDATDVDIKLEEQKFSFTGRVGDKQYATTVDLKDKIKVEESSYRVLPRQIELKLKKETEGPYWNKLQSGGKNHMIEIDWTRWVDEDEQKDEDFGGFGAGGDFGGMGGLGGMGGGLGGMGGLGGLGGMGGLGGLGGMGGFGGMPGMEGLGGMGDFGGEDDMGGDSDDEDDQGPPPLESGAPGEAAEPSAGGAPTMETEQSTN